MNQPLFAFLCLAGAAIVTAEQPPRITVLTYNIQIGTGMDKKIDLERTAQAIRSVNPDIVALQEVDRKARRTNGVDQGLELARLTGMQLLFGKASVREGIDEDGGDYGVAILTRFPVLRSVRRQLPYTKGFELRAVLEAELEWRDANGRRMPLRFFSTHFDNAGANDRVASANVLVELANKNPTIPTILGGDINAGPDSEPIGILSRAFQSASAGRELPTFPAGTPRRQLDYIFFRPAERWKLVDVRVPDEPMASDHRPVVAVLELLPGAK
jgi:endonuclease/exonuclease/phosphatase family metal-dependent hydrolase